MQANAKCGSPSNHATGCLVAGVFDDRTLTPSARALDEATQGTLSALLTSGDLKGKPGQTLLIHRPRGVSCERLLLVGCGKNGEMDAATFRKVVKGAIDAIKGTAAREATLCLAELQVKGRDLVWKARQAVEMAGNALYLYDATKGEKRPEDRPALEEVTLLLDDTEAQKQAALGIQQGLAIVAGTALARDLGNLPGNICTPTYLADQAEALGKAYKSVKVKLLGEKEMEKLGMGSLLSVAKGSRQEAKLITVEYRGAGKDQKPVALVGKGLTFDAGGISLKPGEKMDEMKYDMCGGASVLGAIKAAAELQLPINVVGVIPSSENLPDGNANKPGDIVTSMAGITIEILNTDAEGRLILCDALTYTKRFEPEVVIDIATLTGACVIALGKHASGLFANDDALAEELIDSGQESGDRVWRMPLWEDYQEQLKSPFADVANVGGREAGAVTGACFLSRFTKEYRWAHLDIAGTAWSSGGEKGATGRPVPLLVQFLLNRA